MQEKIEKLRELKLLFVEDEEDLLNIISSTLSKLKISFLTAKNGKEALGLIEKNNDISLIVTDINMPVMNGISMIKELRKTQKKDIPVVVMSAHTEKEYIDAVKELDVKEYMLKPFDFFKFIDLISNMNIRN